MMAWRALDKANPGFDVVAVHVNGAQPQHVAVTGVRHVHVYRVGMHLEQPLALELGAALDGLACVLHVQWLAGSQVRLAVLTMHAWLLFDLPCTATQPLMVLRPHLRRPSPRRCRRRRRPWQRRPSARAIPWSTSRGWSA